MDVGTSGGIWGLKNGYCMMIGGERDVFEHLRPLFATLAPGEDGYDYFGTHGAGHFTKMVHNGIEYGMMQAYGEGFEIIRNSDYNVDLARLSTVWNHGSVVRSWLLELAELAFQEEGDGLERIRGYVEDSGEGRWTVLEAISPVGARAGHHAVAHVALRLAPERVVPRPGDRRAAQPVRRACRPRRRRNRVRRSPPRL